MVATVSRARQQGRQVGGGERGFWTPPWRPSATTHPGSRSGTTGDQRLGNEFAMRIDNPNFGNLNTFARLDTYASGR